MERAEKLTVTRRISALGIRRRQISPCHQQSDMDAKLRNIATLEKFFHRPQGHECKYFPIPELSWSVMLKFVFS